MSDFKNTPEYNQLRGQAEALRVAILVIVKMLPPSMVEEFKAAYPASIENWKEAAIGFPVTDEWFRAIDTTSNTLLRALD